MFNHFVISGNQKDSCLGEDSGSFSWTRCARSSGGVCGRVCARVRSRAGWAASLCVYSPMTSAELTKAMKVRPGTLHMSKVNGGKYPIIHVQIKTQRSGLMKAFGGGVGGGAVILSNREGSPANTALIKTLC